MRVVFPSVLLMACQAGPLCPDGPAAGDTIGLGSADGPVLAAGDADSVWVYSARRLSQLQCDGEVPTVAEDVKGSSETQLAASGDRALLAWRSTEDLRWQTYSEGRAEGPTGTLATARLRDLAVTEVGEAFSVGVVYDPVPTNGFQPPTQIDLLRIGAENIAGDQRALAVQTGLHGIDLATAGREEWVVTDERGVTLLFDGGLFAQWADATPDPRRLWVRSVDNVAWVAWQTEDGTLWVSPPEFPRIPSAVALPPLAPDSTPALVADAAGLVVAWEGVDGAVSMGVVDADGQLGGEHELGPGSQPALVAVQPGFVLVAWADGGQVQARYEGL